MFSTLDYKLSFANSPIRVIFSIPQQGVVDNLFQFALSSLSRQQGIVIFKQQVNDRVEQMYGCAEGLVDEW